MDKQTAIDTFRRLVGTYGLRWTASVPAAAYDELAEVNRVLTERDRRAALGLRN